jgi:hypothetical protein
MLLTLNLYIRMDNLAVLCDLLESDIESREERHWRTLCDTVHVKQEAQTCGLVLKYAQPKVKLTADHNTKILDYLHPIIQLIQIKAIFGIITKTRL